MARQLWSYLARSISTFRVQRQSWNVTALWFYSHFVVCYIPSTFCLSPPWLKPLDPSRRSSWVDASIQRNSHSLNSSVAQTEEGPCLLMQFCHAANHATSQGSCCCVPTLSKSPCVPSHSAPWVSTLVVLIWMVDIDGEGEKWTSKPWESCLLVHFFSWS